MPLTPFQHEVLRLLAGRRGPDSHLAGGAVINRADDSPRFSADLDVFHDSSARVQAAAAVDAAELARHGFSVSWSLTQPSLHRADITHGADSLRLDWVHDSAFRFFPVQPDPEFGYCLHPADLATNKCLALAGRSEVRDFIDIMYLHKSYLPLGAIAWAACGKDQGFTPWSLLEHASRHMKFRDEQLAGEHLARPIRLADLKEGWLEAAGEAEKLFARLPVAEAGCLYLDSNLRPITPNPADVNFAALTRHRGTVGGAIPKLTSP